MTKPDHENQDLKNFYELLAGDLAENFGPQASYDRQPEKPSQGAPAHDE